MGEGRCAPMYKALLSPKCKSCNVSVSEIGNAVHVVIAIGSNGSFCGPLQPVTSRTAMELRAFHF